MNYPNSFLSVDFQPQPSTSKAYHKVSLDQKIQKGQKSKKIMVKKSMSNNESDNEGQEPGIDQESLDTESKGKISSCYINFILIRLGGLLAAF